MYCFVMKLSMSTAKEIEKDLRVGSLAKHVKVTRLDQAFRMSYDFLSIYYSLHALSGYQSSGYLAMTDFKNPFFFKLNTLMRFNFHCRFLQLTSSLMSRLHWYSRSRNAFVTAQFIKRHAWRS